MIEPARRVVEAWAGRRPLDRWGVPIAWAGLIWFLSSRTLSGSAPGMATAFLFNSAHVVVFGLLAGFLHAALRSSGWRRFAIAAGLAAAYGALDEFHQAFVPGRQSSVFDWASDASGAVLCAAVLTWLRERPVWAARTAVTAVPVSVASVFFATLW